MPREKKLGLFDLACGLVAILALVIGAGIIVISAALAGILIVRGYIHVIGGK